MSNLELIEDYLSDKLSEQQKEAFEKQLATDTALKSEVALQKAIVEGIKNARIAELKSMLNNVPISPVGSFATAGKIAAGVIAVGIISASIYFYTKSGDDKPETVSITDSVSIPTEEPKAKENKETPAVDTKATDKSETTTAVTTPVDNNKKKTVTTPEKDKEEKITPTKPSINVTDPSEEMSDNTSTAVTPKNESSKSIITTSRVAVETDASDKKHTFHYQFKQSKLILFGKFDKALYEILEVNGDSHSMFLFYKDNYYLLNENQTTISPLEQIKDASVVRKLKEFRNQ